MLAVVRLIDRHELNVNDTKDANEVAHRHHEERHKEEACNHQHLHQNDQCRDCPVPGCIFRIGSTDTGLLL